MNNKTGIILIGAGGRMGRAIAGLLHDNDECFLAAAVDRPEVLETLPHLPCYVTDHLEEGIERNPDAVIVDFTMPDASMKAAAIAAEKHVPIVIGSTGFSETQKIELQDFAKKTPLLWSANMSIGVNALEDLLPRLARALGPNYDIEIAEIHHRHKKDAPSGTALMLGNAIANARGQKLEDVRKSCRDGIIGERKKGEIGVQAIRGGEVVGVHMVWFFGPSETIEITHRADSRENFALGALRAARWLAGRQPGKMYSMQDALAE